MTDRRRIDLEKVRAACNFKADLKDALGIVLPEYYEQPLGEHARRALVSSNPMRDAQ